MPERLPVFKQIQYVDDGEVLALDEFGRLWFGVLRAGEAKESARAEWKKVPEVVTG